MERITLQVKRWLGIAEPDLKDIAYKDGVIKEIIATRPGDTVTLSHIVRKAENHLIGRNNHGLMEVVREEAEGRGLPDRRKS